MSRHGFGQGEYKYFANPLPPIIQSLRELLYPGLAEIANRWESQLGSDVRYPTTLSAFQDQCHAVGQTRPTPLILKYEHGGYNCLHQDLYGAVHFPLQIVVLLSDPGRPGTSGSTVTSGDGDFEGGEFVLTEQRPRMQSRAQVLPLQRGVGVVFPVNNRPRQGVRGFYRVKQRHGVSTVLRGNRFSLGIIFHDAA